jgi:hypothetical protein
MNEEIKTNAESQEKKAPLSDSEILDWLDAVFRSDMPFDIRTKVTEEGTEYEGHDVVALVGLASGFSVSVNNRDTPKGFRKMVESIMREDADGSGAARPEGQTNSLSPQDVRAQFRRYCSQVYPG